MHLILLVAVPALAGLLAFTIRRDAPRRALLVVTALVHALLTAAAWIRQPAPTGNGWFALDALGLLFLSLASLLFLAAACYAIGYLGREVRGERPDFIEGVVFSNAPETVFTACLLFFLAAMTLVTVSQHLGLLWVGIEATSLASAPLIYFHRHRRSLEAAWKYLLICSVGIAVALLGYLLLAVAGLGIGRTEVSMLLPDLVAGGLSLNNSWLRAAFILFLVGYGTKMGLAPLHTWLPDAHSESPSLVSALLSGALLNCAFLGILRVQQVMSAAGEARFGRELLTGFGLVSLFVAAVFIVGQTDYKRMLAYSSVEHMGIMALGVGIAGGATAGALLHAVNHSLTKGLLFLTAGNLLARYRTKNVADVRGALRLLPVSGPLWVAGFLAIVGSPPFGPFVSELMILKGMVDGGRHAVAVAYSAALVVIFIGMAGIVLPMAQGEPPAVLTLRTERETWTAFAPPLALLLLVTILGLYVPAFLREAIATAAATLEGS